ncbi:transposase [Amycolatopsis aidingensis]|uniref:transposase n=1 Tax=Amycolatopsis aidingensis TaxID=2842453 RepID=UPI001C0D4744|nr:transposase [Amycolatopsis aidingensis]
MGRRGYPPEFRWKVLDLVEAGRRVADVARDLGISDRSIYTWRRQDRIDRGLEPGLSSVEKAELTAAKQRIAELEAELAVHRRAGKLLKEAVPQKLGTLRSRRWLRKACRSRWPAGYLGVGVRLLRLAIPATNQPGRSGTPG